MPGAVRAMTRHVAAGWARHPRQPSYPVIVNLVLRAKVLRSVIADQAEAAGGNGGNGRQGFTIELADLDLGAEDYGRLSFIIGETDELLAIPGPDRRARADAGRPLRLEDILSPNTRRPWVTGCTWHDAEQAGLCPADILDLIYRDILGRPPDPPGFMNYLRLVQEDGKSYDLVRKSMIESGEYRARSVPALQAPGAVFSQGIALHTGRLAGGTPPVLPERRSFDVGPLLTLEPAAFLFRVYRDVLRQRAEPKTLDRHRDRLAAGLAPLDLLRELVDTARAAGVEIELHHPDPVPGTPAGMKPAAAAEAEPASPLFTDGWHAVEQARTGTARWMAKAGTVLNPHPDVPVATVAIRVHSVYGAASPILRCFLGDEEAVPEVEPEGSGFRVWLHPRPTGARFASLRIVSLASGCPLREGNGTDGRTLSLLVTGVAFTYAGPEGAGPEGAGPDGAGP